MNPYGRLKPIVLPLLRRTLAAMRPGDSESAVSPPAPAEESGPVTPLRESERPVWAPPVRAMRLRA